MTLDEFVDQYDFAPYSMQEFAEAAKDVEDTEELSEAAERYLEAKREFRKSLSSHGVEIG